MVVKVHWKLVYRPSQADADVLSKVTYISALDAERIGELEFELDCFPSELDVKINFVDTKTDNFVDYIRSWAQERLDGNLGTSSAVGITRIEQISGEITIYLHDELYWNVFAQAKVKDSLFQFQPFMGVVQTEELASNYDELYTYYALRFCIARRLHALLSGNPDLEFEPLSGLQDIEWNTDKNYGTYSVSIGKDFKFYSLDAGAKETSADVTIRNLLVPRKGGMIYDTSAGGDIFQTLFKKFGNVDASAITNAKATLGSPAAKKSSQTSTPATKLYEYKVKAYVYFQLMHMVEDKLKGDASKTGKILEEACSFQATAQDVDAMFKVDRESYFIRFLRVQHIDKDLTWEEGALKRGAQGVARAVTGAFASQPFSFGGRTKDGDHTARRRPYVLRARN